MGTVTDLGGHAEALASPPSRRRIDRGGGGGDDGRMEARISALEGAHLETRDRLARIETRLDHMATKADLNAAVATFERAFAGVEKSFAGVEKSFAGVEKSFAHIEKSLHALTWRIIGSCALLVAAAFFIAKHVS